MPRFNKSCAVLFLLLCFVTGCRAWPTNIVYDEVGSSKTGVASVQCAASYAETCKADAVQDEALFAEKLANDFQAETECKGLTFVIDHGEANDPATSAKLAQVKLQRYWSLRADYRPHLMNQEAEMRLSGDRLLLGIEADTGKIDRSAEFIIQSACKMSKKGGTGADW